MYRLATKRTEKNESMKTWWRVFETNNHACTGRVTWRTKLFTDFVWTTELWCAS